MKTWLQAALIMLLILFLLIVKKAKNEQVQIQIQALPAEITSRAGKTTPRHYGSVSGVSRLDTEPHKVAF